MVPQVLKEELEKLIDCRENWKGLLGTFQGLKSQQATSPRVTVSVIPYRLGLSK